MSSSSTPAPPIDIDSPVFAMRFANLLRATRLDRGISYRALVRATGGTWTKDQLKHVEDGLLTLDESMVESVSMAYGADLGSILPSRLPVAIDAGVISAGGVKAVFVPRNETSLLTAYLRLIRTMRRQRKAPMIALRREDIEVLSAHLDVPGEAVVDRLTALMGATLPQRTAIAAMFATGAVVIGLAGATVAGGPDRTSNDVSDQQTVAVVAEATATTASVPAARSDGTDPTATTPTATRSTIASSSNGVGTPDVITITIATAVPPPTPSTEPVVVITSAPRVVSAPSGVSQPATAPVTAAIAAGSAEPPLVPEATVPATVSDPTAIVATDDPPVPPVPTVVATGDPVVPGPGSAEPPLVPPQPPPAPVEVGTPPVPG